MTSNSVPFHPTPEQRMQIENRLVQIFSDIIDLDCPDDAEYPLWGDTTNQLMEVIWNLYHMHRIIDHDTHRDMSMQRMATIIFSKLHRRLPSNIYSVARQSLHTHRPPVVDYYAWLKQEADVDPSIFIVWQKPIELPPVSSYRNLF